MNRLNIQYLFNNDINIDIDTFSKLILTISNHLSFFIRHFTILSNKFKKKKEK